ncbi:MAG: hypothetical protein WBE32_21675, partial [Pseudolabrys sp.]
QGGIQHKRQPEQRFENHLLDLVESGSAIEVSQSESQCTKNLHYLTGELREMPHERNRSAVIAIVVA